MPEPEALARIDIDRQLEAAGWIVQDRAELNLFAGPGIAIREVSIPGAGETDYLLVAGRKAVGIVEASAGTWGEFNEQQSKTCNDIIHLREDLLIQPDDFPISRANTIELVGACIIVRDVNLPLMLSDKVLRITFGPRLDQRWALHLLRRMQGRHEIESRATGNQLSMRNIGQKRIKAIPIPVPPLETQHTIIEEIERRLSVIDQLEATVETNLKRTEALRQSILRKAFSGELSA